MSNGKRSSSNPLKTTATQRKIDAAVAAATLSLTNEHKFELSSLNESITNLKNANKSLNDKVVVSDSKVKSLQSNVSRKSTELSVLRKKVDDKKVELLAADSSNDVLREKSNRVEKNEMITRRRLAMATNRNNTNDITIRKLTAEVALERDKSCWSRLWEIF